jgi:hypothetical protein
MQSAMYLGYSLTVEAGNLQFRPLQNSEDLHMHYAIGDLEHYDTISPHLSDTYEI